jgi:hypothetical protein
VGLTQSFDVLGDDGKGGTTHQTWAVTPAADAGPVFTSTPATTGTTGTVYAYTPTATDADGDSVSYSLIANPSWASLTGNSVTGTPTAGGSVSFTLRADDGHGKTADQTWSLMVTPAGNLAPIITSTPPTTATGGTAYTYVVQASDPNSDAVIIHLISGPAGASLIGNTLTWTPTPGQERVTAAFQVEASDVWGATSVPQTWGVTPAGTIHGTRLINYTLLDWATGKISRVPVPDPGNPSFGALVPMTGNEFATVSGSYNAADGSFTVGPVSAGGYWLRINNVYVWTDQSTVDLSSLRQGRQDQATALIDPTNVSFSLTGMSPWASSDGVQFFDWNSGVYTYLDQDRTSANVPSAGDTALSGLTDNWANSFYGVSARGLNLVRTGEGDHPLVAHMGSVTAGGQTFQVAKDIFEVSSLTMSNGTPATVSGAFTTPLNAPTPFALNLAHASFLNAKNAINPSGLLLTNAAAYLLGLPDPSKSGTFGSTLDVVRFMNPTGTSDLNLGNITIPALPPAFGLWWYAGYQFRKPFLYPGATTAISTYYWVQAQGAVMPTVSSPMSPVVTPVQNPQINGQSFFNDRTGMGVAPLLTWSAPATGTPTYYQVSIWQLGFSGTQTTDTLVASFYLPGTSLQVPYGILNGGTYHFNIRAVVSPSRNLATAPFWFYEQVTYGIADCSSGMITN